MGWPVERIVAVCGPVTTAGRGITREEGRVMTAVGEVPVAVHRARNTNRVTVHVGPIPNLTPEQADRLLTLLRAVPPYPKPAGRTVPGEPVAWEVGGEG